MRLAIAKAVSIQRKRQSKKNARLLPAEIAEFCKTEENVRSFLDKNAEKIGFSPRAVASCLKIARTIADMEGAEQIQQEHIREAVEFRKPFSNFMMAE